MIDNPIVFVASINREVQYQDFVAKLFKHDTQDMEHMHAALGVAGEAGELADAIKKHVVYGKELDRKNVVEELGDLRFYMQQIMNMHDISEDEVLQRNADKLSKRYPKGEYSNVAAVARLDKMVAVKYCIAQSSELASQGMFVAGPFSSIEEAKQSSMYADGAVDIYQIG